MNLVSFRSILRLVSFVCFLSLNNARLGKIHTTGCLIRWWQGSPLKGGVELGGGREKNEVAGQRTALARSSEVLARVWRK